MAIELSGGAKHASRFLKRLKLVKHAPSLGGVETLLTRPAQTSHAGLDPDVRRQIGISDGLIRMSVGIEAAEDILEDLLQALG